MGTSWGVNMDRPFRAGFLSPFTRSENSRSSSIASVRSEVAAVKIDKYDENASNMDVDSPSDRRGVSSQERRDSLLDRDGDREVSPEELWCTCRGVEEIPMIGCDGGCNDWYHGKCVGMTEEDMDRVDSYVCPHCTEPGECETTFKTESAIPAAIPPIPATDSINLRSAKTAAPEELVSRPKPIATPQRRQSRPAGGAAGNPIPQSRKPRKQLRTMLDDDEAAVDGETSAGIDMEAFEQTGVYKFVQQEMNKKWPME